MNTPVRFELQGEASLLLVRLQGFTNKTDACCYLTNTHVLLPRKNVTEHVWCFTLDQHSFITVLIAPH